jgi:hypothetical protein
MPEVSKYAGSAKYAGSVELTAVVIEGLAENFHFPFQDRRSDGMLASDELRSPLRDPFPAFVAYSDSQCRALTRRYRVTVLMTS